MTSRLISPWLAVLALAACAFSSSAWAASAPLPSLLRATSGLSDAGKDAVGILILGRGQQADYDAALLRSAAARYALRRLDVVILRRDGNRYVPEMFQGQCDGQDACAADAFLDGIPDGDVNHLIGHDAGNTTFVVYDAGAHLIGTAHGGFDSLHALTRFASSLRKATPAHPAQDYADSVMADIP
jgi:hypothetical protein